MHELVINSAHCDANWKLTHYKLYYFRYLYASVPGTSEIRVYKRNTDGSLLFSEVSAHWQIALLMTTNLCPDTSSGDKSGQPGRWPGDGCNLDRGSSSHVRNNEVWRQSTGYKESVSGMDSTSDTIKHLIANETGPQNCNERRENGKHDRSVCRRWRFLLWVLSCRSIQGRHAGWECAYQTSVLQTFVLLNEIKRLKCAVETNNVHVSVVYIACITINTVFIWVLGNLLWLI
jgi:hypothetical protein